MWSSQLQKKPDLNHTLPRSHRNFVKILSMGISSSLLKAFARSTLGVHDLMTFEKHVVDILAGFGDLGKSQLQAIQDHRQQVYEATGHRPNKKLYERETERCNELLKHVQRVKVTMLEGKSDLTELPLQLGFADMAQWMSSGDSCHTSP